MVDQTEEKYRFDARRKILHRTVLQKDKITLAGQDAGSYDITNKQEYTEEGVRALVGELKRQRQDVQNALSRVNATIDATNHLEDDDSLRALRESLNRLKQIESRYKAQEQRDSLLLDLQMIGKQHAMITEAVGSHIPDL